MLKNWATHTLVFGAGLYGSPDVAENAVDPNQQEGAVAEENKHRPVFTPPGQMAPSIDSAIILNERMPLKTQTDILSMAHRTLTGVVQGDCAGQLWIDYYQEIPDALSATPSGNAPQPLTRIQLNGTGDFSLAAPGGYKGSCRGACGQQWSHRSWCRYAFRSAFVAHSGNADDLVLPLSTEINPYCRLSPLISPPQVV